MERLANKMMLGTVAAFMLTGPSTKLANPDVLRIMLNIKHFLICIAFVIVGADTKKDFGIDTIPKPFFMQETAGNRIKRRHTNGQAPSMAKSVYHRIRSRLTNPLDMLQ